MSKCCCDDCVKTICPLPRIGSKEWGWTHCQMDYAKGWWQSPSLQYQVSWHRGKIVVVNKDAEFLAHPRTVAEGRRRLRGF